MKNLKVTLAAMMIALFTVFGANKAQAQVNTGDLQAGLINLNVALVEAGVNVGDVTLTDLVDIGNITVTDVIDITNVLNNNDVRILTDFLKNIKIDNVLNNLLRDANIITGNQVVVGILSGVIVVADKKALKLK